MSALQQDIFAVQDVPLPNDKGEFSCPADGAKWMAGVHKIPQTPLWGKKPFLKDWPNTARTDFDWIDECAKKYPGCNFGSVAKKPTEDQIAKGNLEGHFVLEVDSADVRATYKQETGHDFTAELIIISGEGRGHRWYAFDKNSLDLPNIGQEDAAGFSLRVNNELTVSPGGLHPERGTQYRVDMSHRSAPTIASAEEIAWFKSKKRTNEIKKAETTASGERVLIQHGAFYPALIAQAGRLWNQGFEPEDIPDLLCKWADANLQPPIDYGKVRQYSAGANWKRGEPGRDWVYTAGQLDGAKPNTDPRSCFKTIGELPDGGVDWVIHNFFPEGLGFVGALSGHGKTFVGLSIARALTTGRLFLNTFYVPKVTPVLYLIPETSGRPFKARCKKFGIPDDENLFLCRTISEGPILPLNSPEIVAIVSKLKCVVFIDTAIRFSGADDENAAKQQLKLWHEMNALRLAGAPLVVALHHSVKSSKNEAMSLENVLRGSGEIGAQADAVWGIRRDDMLFANGEGPNEVLVQCVKPRDFEPPEPFRLGLTYKADDGKLHSYLDEIGDFKVLSKGQIDGDLESRFVKAVKEFSQASVTDLAEMLGEKRWKILNIAKKLHYTKKRGGEWITSGAVDLKNIAATSEVSLDPKASE